MKEHLYDLAANIVYEVADKEKNSIEFTLPKNDSFSRIKYGDIIQISVPYPKQIGGKYQIQGILFDNLEKSSPTVWSLFLASLYHSGGHAAITNNSVYQKCRSFYLIKEGLKTLFLPRRLN